MFPPNSMNPSSIAPLTGGEFMQKILVPEVALRLIIEDNQFVGERGKQEALTILRESSAYGVFMFPEDGGESNSAKRLNGDKLGVGDMIVMERAKKRRKELEEEEAKQRAVFERIRARRDKKGTRKVTDALGSADERHSSCEVETVPLSRPVAKGYSSTSIFSLSEDRQRSEGLRSRSRSVLDDTDPASGFETAIEIGESDSDDGQQAAQQGWWHSSAETVGTQLSSSHSTNGGLASLNLSSDSDLKVKTFADTGRMTRSRSRSVMLSQHAFLNKKMGNSSDVEVLDMMVNKTPVATPRVKDVEDNDKTPVAATQRRKAITPPLLKARQRRIGSVTR